MLGAPGSDLGCPYGGSVGSFDFGAGSSAGELIRAEEGLDYVGNFAPSAQLAVQQFISDAMYVRMLVAHVHRTTAMTTMSIRKLLCST
jgi:hypothetical protein